MTGRVFYIQYANPAAYPPVVNSATLLAERGWDVRVLGIEQPATKSLHFPAHPRVSVDLREEARGGWRRVWHYAMFVGTALRLARAQRPHWLYACDPWSAPAAWVLARLTSARVVYHEHDAPDLAGGGLALRVAVAFRNRLARHAEIAITPNATRSRELGVATGRHTPVTTVWNCPGRHEISETPQPAADAGTALRIVYGGTLVPARVPVEVVEALATQPGAEVVLMGYETIGHPGYCGALLERARALNIEQRVRVRGCTERSAYLQAFGTADLGLALMPIRPTDSNEQHMVGASNKVFEYLAQGTPVLVSDSREWRDAFVARGVALACDPSVPADIARAFAWVATHRSEARAMGERGRQLVRDQWNYERQFAPVQQQMEASV